MKINFLLSFNPAGTKLLGNFGLIIAFPGKLHGIAVSAIDLYVLAITSALILPRSQYYPKISKTTTLGKVDGVEVYRIHYRLDYKDYSYNVACI